MKGETEEVTAGAARSEEFAERSPHPNWWEAARAGKRRGCCVEGHRGTAFHPRKRDLLQREDLDATRWWCGHQKPKTRESAEQGAQYGYGCVRSGFGVSFCGEEHHFGRRS